MKRACARNWQQVRPKFGTWYYVEESPIPAEDQRVITPQNAFFHYITPTSADVRNMYDTVTRRGASDTMVVVLQPLDEPFDVITLPPNTSQGAAARKHLSDANLIAPTYNRQLPDQIDAFYTKDWTSSKPKFSR